MRRFHENENVVGISNIDEYMEKLYDDDISIKVIGSQMIRKLAQKQENWKFLMMNHSLMNLLSRTLRNHGKVNLVLNINILFIFLNLSRVEEFHERILSYGIHEVILQRIKYENGRFLKILEKKDLEEKKKIKFFEKQTKLLTVCLYLLLNLFSKIEINPQELVDTLIGMLRRHTGESNITKLISEKETDSLLVIVIQLLLSLFQRDRDLLLNDQKVLLTLISLLEYRNDEIVYFVLKVIGLLAFETNPNIETILIQSIPKFILLAKRRGKVFFETLKILYELSKNPQSLPFFRAPEQKLNRFTGFEFILKLMIVFPTDKTLPRELVALGINLCHDLGHEVNPKNLEMLMKIFFKTGNPLLCKLINNICFHEKMRKYFNETSLVLFCKLMLKHLKNPSVSYEVLSILGKMSTEEKLSFKPLFQKRIRFDKILNQVLSIDVNEDDILLEGIIVTGTILDRNDSSPIAKILAKTRTIQKCSTIFLKRQNDEEFVLQSLYTFHSFLKYEETMINFFQEEETIDTIINLYDHKNGLIKNMVDSLLEILSEVNEQYKRKIIRKKFEIFNAEWIAATSQSLDDSSSLLGESREDLMMDSSAEYYDDNDNSNEYYEDDYIGDDDDGEEEEEEREEEEEEYHFR